MLMFLATTGVDITQEIPIEYWVLFIAVMAFVLPLANRLLTHMFIPKNDDEEAPVWSAMSRKERKNKKH